MQLLLQFSVAESHRGVISAAAAYIMRPSVLLLPCRLRLSTAVVDHCVVHRLDANTFGTCTNQTNRLSSPAYSSTHNVKRRSKFGH